MAEPSGGDIAGRRIASIVVEALEPAERTGGVAYLCVTPFAAGQTLAVPLQPIAIDRDCEAEYYARLHEIQPELLKLAASLDDQSAALRKEMTATVSELVAGAFAAGR